MTLDLHVSEGDDNQEEDKERLENGSAESNDGEDDILSKGRSNPRPGVKAKVNSGAGRIE